MKYIKLITIIIGVFICSNTLFSQENLIVKSKVVKTINGKNYYIHTVKKAETIYSICQVYGITEKQLAIDNAEIFNGLKLGQELKIFKQSGRPLKKSPDYIYFKIEKGQTVYSITKKYKITEGQFFEYNPGAKAGLKLGMDVKIKRQSLKQEIKHEARLTDTPYTKHKVKRKETLYYISKKYNVSQEEILSANPLIRENGLKKGDIINIPTKEFIKNLLWQKTDTLKQQDTLDTDTLVVKPDEVIFNKNETIRIGLLLPFDLDIKTLNIEQKNKKTDGLKRPKTKPFFEIYQGVLFKLKELKEQGYKIDLYAYDTKKSAYTIKTIMDKPEIKLLDIIIGPIYKNIFDTALKYKPVNVPIINPLVDVSTKFNINYPFIQVEPSEAITFKEVTNYISSIDEANYIIISDGTQDKLKTVRKYSHELRKLKKDSITIHNVNFTENKMLRPFIRKTKNNVVLILSTKEGFVTNAVTKLHIASSRDSVILIGFKEWLKYKIPTEYYHKLNLTLFTNRNVNYCDNEILEFNKTYKDEYNCEPSKYSYIGYDILDLVITNYSKCKSNIYSCITNTKIDGKIFKFRFDKLNNHFENIYLNRIQYKNDLSIEIK